MPRRLAPGFWEDDEDNLHVSIPELLKHFGWPDDAEHRALVMQAVKDELADSSPGTELRYAPDCPTCGVSGMAAHKTGCRLARGA